MQKEGFKDSLKHKFKWHITNSVFQESKRQMQPGLPAVTYGSCQTGLTDKFDFLHLNDGVRKKAEVTMWAIKAKGIVHSQAKSILLSLKLLSFQWSSSSIWPLSSILSINICFLIKKILSLTKPNHYNFIF